MDYKIMRQVDGREFAPVLNKRTQQPATYPSARSAATAAALLTKLHGAKHQPRPVAEEAADWRTKVRVRFAEFKPVVWVGLDWWEKNHKPDHFAHTCQEDATLIAFIRDDKCGEAGTWTNVKPGKYLTEFFSHVLSGAEISALALKHAAIYEKKELKFATTPEEIERVYKANIGNSCFSGTKNANCYGSGDFAVAYIEDAAGNVKARAVCAPARKKYVRVYGDVVRLDSLLAAAGYTQSANYYRTYDYDGLRILKAYHYPGWYADFTSTVSPDPKDDKFLIIKGRG